MQSKSNGFDHKKIESKWQKKWAESGIYNPDLKTSKKPYYNLMMFPYPSAEGLHVGNMYAFTGADVYGRFKRMQGYDVFEPIGLDGFGIHSENYAIKVGRHPKEHAKISEENFYNQLSKIGNGFSWDSRLETYDPEYYKWTQWLFIKMFEAGLAYKASALVNWCPSCKTVLADEQVIDGKCERCGTTVTKKETSSWFFKITDYADRLLTNIDKIDWPERIKNAQRNWIGKAKGLSVEFEIENSKVKVATWTKFWETVFGTTFLVVAPEYAEKHLSKLVPKSKTKSIKKYIEGALSKSGEERKENKDKTGVDTGIFAVNPVNGKKIPVFVADYVLTDVGTGAVMGVPAHDARDFEFAIKHSLKILPVVVPERDYVDANAKSYYKKRSSLHRELLKKLVTLAKKANKKLMLTGGWAVCAHVGYEFRDFEDLDLVIMEEDVVWWKDSLKKIGLKIENLYPGKNEKYYFQATKKDIHVDLGAIRVNEKGRVLWLDDTKLGESDLFDKMFEVSELFGQEVYIMNRDLLIYLKSSHKGEKRWKEQADFLFLGHKSYEGEGQLINSGKFDGLAAWGEGKEKMANWMEASGLAKKQTNYHLRDWLISRQRYWGPPIPMINCKECGWQAVPEKDLPVTLPDIEDFKPKGDGVSPLHNAPESWKQVDCPKCGGVAERELDVSDTFLDSSWYFLAYPNLATSEWKGNSSPVNAEVTKNWLPVDSYIGGAEHAVLHLLYARFVTMVLCDKGYVDFEEPFPFLYGHGLIIKDGAKMSKSKGNVVNPDTYIDKFGADALRAYLMFLGPYDQGGDFRDTGMEGMKRFLNRVWKAFEKEVKPSKDDLEKVCFKAHQTIKKVTEEISEFKFNTSIAAIMELTNLILEKGADARILKTLAQLLAPFAPHMTEELWSGVLKQKGSIHTSSWPKYNEDYLKESALTVIIQVSGKMRGQITLDEAKASDEEVVTKLAKAEAGVAKWLDGVEVKKVIFVPNKLINFVI